MRSVVVVLPASICAMIPMLRTLSRAFVATVASSSSQCFKRWVRCLPDVQRAAHIQRRTGVRYSRPALLQQLPAVVREGLVRLGHLVRVLTPLDRCAEAIGG